MKKDSLRAQKLKTYFCTHLAEAQKYFEEAVSNGPTRKNVYKLRVSLRRIRSVLEVLNSNNSCYLSEEEEREFRKIFKLLGRQRDVEVAIENGKQLSFDVGPLQVLRKERQQETMAGLKPKTLFLILTALNLAAQTIRDEDLKLNDHVKNLKADLGSDFVTVEEVHRFRIVLKRIRYLLEALGVPVAPFKSTQDVLGHFNDLENLQKLLGPKKLLEKALKIELENARKAVISGKKLAFGHLASLENSLG